MTPSKSEDTPPPAAHHQLSYRYFSKRLILSYILDWVLIVGVALIGYGFSQTTPNHRPFSLTDPSISFPHKEKDTVSTGVLAVVAVIAPAVIIIVVSFLFINPDITTIAGTSAQNARREILIRKWMIKLWEWNAGWMGLGVALAGAFMATQGLKDLYGKPRPDMLARCDPDISAINEYAISGLGRRLAGAPTMVTWEICRNKVDEMLKVDGFASFPSGHSSISFAGLMYLALWLSAKFSIGFPFLAYSPLSQDLRRQDRGKIRKQGAAPPVYMLIVALVPVAVAFFISASRWFDYRHHGFDIIFGSVMGIVFAWIGFRLYQLPIIRGAGWSWGARSRRHAFFMGVGLPSHVAADNWVMMNDKRDAVESSTHNVDLESGRQGPEEH
ncbi:phosphatidic acid phosphatase type [Aspergillus brasiliensis]|uniref:Phosphatidic acid phosphatase type n=1 Tax=Aspergillus brasiliensis TaxID=319629 RepID=A0A9W5YK51_9EURO|nr:phosphatidic acid phosphatase type [Aspergillus brasiliensis]GKZ42526.1 phosphatidic acid phosphatase type [Aspergillus brasiliensis]